MTARVQRLNPEGLASHRASIYSQVVVVEGGRTVYVAGQVSRDAQGVTVAVGDVAAQTEQVIANLRLALAAAHAELRHIVIRPGDGIDAELDRHMARSRIAEARVR